MFNQIDNKMWKDQQNHPNQGRENGSNHSRNY